MLRSRTGLTLTWLTAVGLNAALPVPAAMAASAQQPDAYSVEVSDVFAGVGEHAVMHVTLRLRDGYKVLEAYTNRLGRFSSLDDGVTFDDKMVSGAVQGNTLVFAIGVTPTKLGKHPINGVFRVGYIENSENMSEVSVPLIANVTGTQ
jgi:hypothetical protein